MSLSEIDSLRNQLQLCKDEMETTRQFILHNEKMSSLGSLVAGFTHDLSTPIGLGITGMSSFVEQTDILKKLYESQEMSQVDFEKYLSRAKKTADLVYTNLMDASELMFSFKTISVDQTSLRVRKFNLHDYFDSVVSSLHNKLKHTKVSITNNIDKEIELNSLAGAYSQIFTNLVMNSLIHAFKKGEDGIIGVDATISDDFIYLKYSDDGVGMREQDLENIFTPFFTTKVDEGGSGLGTNIIHDLVTNTLQGRISVKSEYKKGTTFEIAIPLKLAND